MVKSLYLHTNINFYYFTMRVDKRKVQVKVEMLNKYRCSVRFHYNDSVKAAIHCKIVSHFERYTFEQHRYNEHILSRCILEPM